MLLFVAWKLISGEFGTIGYGHIVFKMGKEVRQGVFSSWRRSAQCSYADSPQLGRLTINAMKRLVMLCGRRLMAWSDLMGCRAVRGCGVGLRIYSACLQIRGCMSLHPECQFVCPNTLRFRAVKGVSGMHGISDSLIACNCSRSHHGHEEAMVGTRFRMNDWRKSCWIWAQSGSAVSNAEIVVHNMVLFMSRVDKRRQIGHPDMCIGLVLLGSLYGFVWGEEIRKVEINGWLATC